MSDIQAGPDVTWSKFLLSLTKAMSDRALKWAALLLSCGIGIGAMVRPDPVRAGLATLLILAMSPLWLRRDKADG